MAFIKNFSLLRIASLTMLVSSVNAYAEGVLTRSERLKFCMKDIKCFSYKSTKDMQCNNDYAAKEAKMIESCMEENGFHSSKDEYDHPTDPESYSKESDTDE